MIENLKVTITTEARTADFVLTFDSDFAADRDMRTVINRDGACEPEIVHLMARVLKDGDIAVDGGANVGFFTCLMAQFVGRNGLVFAAEPSPINLAKLEHNLANNKIGNVRVVKAPLCDSIGERILHLAPHSGFNSLQPSDQTVGRCKTVSTTIDEMLNGHEPKLIKLDIEGAEGKALAGACITLTYCPYIVVEMNEQALKRFDCSGDDIRDFMSERGFDMFILQPDGRFPLLVPRLTEIVSERQNLMVLFSTQDAVAKAWPKLEMA